MIHDSKASHTARETRVQGHHSATYSPQVLRPDQQPWAVGQSCTALHSTVLFVTVLCCTLVIIRHMMSAGQSKFSARLQGGAGYCEVSPRDCEPKVPESRFSTHFYSPPIRAGNSSVGCTHSSLPWRHMNIASISEHSTQNPGDLFLSPAASASASHHRHRHHGNVEDSHPPQI
jgi:hypothetical protein